MLYCNRSDLCGQPFERRCIEMIHTLTTGQLRKFVSAVGGVLESEIASGQLTTKQLRELAESIGGLRDWPKITGDPQVNFAVDCVTGNDGEEPPYDEALYAAEVEAFRAHGSFA